MDWRNATEENPGFSVYYTESTVEGERYAARKVKNSPSGMWKLVHQASPEDPFLIVYIGNTLKECKAYAEEHMQLRSITQ